VATVVRVRRVDGRGITVGRAEDRPVDVLFDGNRVWSFHLGRDTTRAGLRDRIAEWPQPLRRYLDGRTRLVVRDAATHEVHHDAEVRFGESPERIRVVNRLGHELGIDKSGRLVPTFEKRDVADIDGLVEATQQVIDVLDRAGVAPFVSYGTLLGAVREGRVLGHDNDADISYVSACENPVDVILESYRLQRSVQELGLEVVRYSGAAFKVLVTEADGFKRGLDVFGGFLDHGRLYLMGEVGVPFEREWLYPLGTARIGDYDVPVPARPDKLLEAMYGPGWRLPDPAFQFTTPEATKRALNDWFRGMRPSMRYWQRRYAMAKFHLPQRGPSPVARAAARDALAHGATVLDVGAGKGVDALWMSAQGVPVVAYDYVVGSLHQATRRARKESLPLEARQLNVSDGRSWMSEGARVSRIPGRRVVLAQHLLDATSPAGRENFVRFCAMVLRGGGTAYTQFHTAETERMSDWCRPVDPRVVAGLFRAAGATDVRVREPRRAGRPPAARVVAEWAP